MACALALLTALFVRSEEMKLDLNHSPSGDLVIALRGEFDALGTASIRAGLEQVAGSAGPALVVLDLSRVSFIDSSGVGAIVYLFKRLRALGRNLELTGVHGQVRELMRGRCKPCSRAHICNTCGAVRADGGPEPCRGCATGESRFVSDVFPGG